MRRTQRAPGYWLLISGSHLKRAEFLFGVNQLNIEGVLQNLILKMGLLALDFRDRNMRRTLLSRALHGALGF